MIQSTSKSKFLTVELMGGIGNQLFSLTAGLYLADKLGVRPRIHIRKPKIGEARHSSSVLTLLAEPPLVTLNSPWELFELKMRFGFRALALRLGSSSQSIGRLAKLHVADVLGYDRFLDTARPGDYVIGYFQTYRYLEELRLRNRMVKLHLRDESDWYKSTLQRLKASNPIVIHIRRGDYLLEKNRYIGALSVTFYRSAVELINSQSDANGDPRPIWVFSDQPSVVRDELTGFAEFGSAEFIVAPDGSDPAESLILMSSASSIIISNSTFSWWAGALSKGSTIVAPRKWFRDSPDPESLIPSDWLRVESSWIDN